MTSRERQRGGRGEGAKGEEGGVESDFGIGRSNAQGCKVGLGRLV
jgi:hypothetical protein